MAGFDPSEADYTNNILEGSNPALSTFLGFDSAEDNVNALKLNYKFSIPLGEPYKSFYFK